MNNVLFEIGMEELPARFINNGEKQLKEKTAAWLDGLRIDFEEVISYATPRRLAVFIKGIATTQTTIDEEVRGPQLAAAKDDAGNWTKAAIGFSKGQGQDTEAIYTKEIKGTTYIFVKKHIEGQATVDLLPSFKEIITSLNFPQAMRWGEGTFRFPRPIRWIVALYNDEVIPFEVANVTTNNETFGHRFLGEKIAITDPTTYKKVLSEQFVIVDPAERRALITEQMKVLEAKEGFTIVVEEVLLEEVCNLVEYPTAFFGSYNKDYLQLPSEVLITSMQEHQRYFPVKSTEGALLPHFVAVRNGNEEALANVVAGNEKVLRARLADGVFFYEEDKKKDIDFYLNKLKTVVFQEKIGTIYEKLENIKTIATDINEDLALEPAVRKQVLRAAEICKFDLMTNMVGEFTELQGVIGEYYARYFGEDEAVAKAIKEHYYPVQANSKLASTIPGAVVGVADKLDTIVGSISVGLIPTGSQDPYSLRRQAIGVLRTVTDQAWNISVEKLIERAAILYPDASTETTETIHAFFKNRASFILTQDGIEQDVVNAVLHEEIGVLYYTLKKATLLSKKRHEESFRATEQALVRVMNLGKKHVQTVIDEKLFETESEKVLYETFTNVGSSFAKYHDKYDAENALSQLVELAVPIEQFFEHNMVMDDDLTIRNNRLALVHKISNMIMRFADLTLIEWKQSV